MNTLASCEEMLWNYGFVRVSKSNLINIYKIRQLKPDLNMRYMPRSITARGYASTDPTRRASLSIFRE